MSKGNVVFIKRANKDNPAVKKGESYYRWRGPNGIIGYSRTEPGRFDCPSSKYRRILYDAIKQLQTSVSPSVLDPLLEYLKIKKSYAERKLKQTDERIKILQLLITAVQQQDKETMNSLLKALDDN